MDDKVNDFQKGYQEGFAEGFKQGQEIFKKQILRILEENHSVLKEINSIKTIPAKNYDDEVIAGVRVKEIIQQAEEFVRPRTAEEIAEARQSIRYRKKRF